MLNSGFASYVSALYIQIMPVFVLSLPLPHSQ